MTRSMLIKGGMLICLDGAGSRMQKDLLVEDGRISRIADHIDVVVDEVIDATGQLVLPGFVQAHLHLCQTLFRGAG